ncbi:MAG TPA: PIN domain-containing protein [Lacipirellulaceae bacterium]|nr:PIN domain-containing protein [Lacipirellulaceae bacterium]
MILLDASTIIDAVRARDSEFTRRLLSCDGGVCGVTRAEVLGGARNDRDRANLLTILNGFQQISLPDVIWDDAGALYSQLRSSGVTVPLVDAVIASMGLALNCEVWARDAHFRAIQGVVPRLRLLQEVS